MNRNNNILMIMNRLTYYLISGLIFLFACGSENTEESANKSDSSIVEIETTGNHDQLSNKNGNGVSDPQQIKLDSKFAGFLDKFSKVELPYRIKPQKELNYGKIPFEFQVEYLSKAEGLDKSELEQMQDYAKFYYLSKPICTNKFNAIIYARSEMGSSYYILCTFDNSGKLISFMDFAMYQLIGAGPQAGQEFEMSGSIDKNMKVTTVSDKVIKTYQIGEDGKIAGK
jgi:hypothetical protein